MKKFAKVFFYVDASGNMSGRAYTVSEIDALRQACEMRWLFGTTVIKGIWVGSRSYNERDKSFCVENLVRTYMMAGKIAADIYAADREAALAREAA